MKKNPDFAQYIEMTCAHCGCADYYSGKNMSNAKEYWRSIGGIIYRGRAFCDDKCKDARIKVISGEIKFGLNDGPLLPERYVT